MGEHHTFALTSCPSRIKEACQVVFVEVGEVLRRTLCELSFILRETYNLID